jgi:hypothetical protein
MNLERTFGSTISRKMANKAINSDRKKLRCAPLFASGYGWR